MRFELEAWAFGSQLTIFVECGKLIHGDAFQIPCTRKVYEISKIPIWVDADRLQETLRTEIKWAATFVRSMGAWKGFKKMLFQSDSVPPTDVLWIGDSLEPIQPAREIPKEGILLRVFDGRSQKQRKLDAKKEQQGKGEVDEMDVQQQRNDALRERVDEGEQTQKYIKIS